jgi:hypothetical protein
MRASARGHLEDMQTLQLNKPTTVRFLLSLVAFTALAGTGCGVASYTEKEARGATDGETGFVFVDDAGLRGVVEATELGGGPLYALHVTFIGVDAPLVSDLRVGIVDVPAESLRVTADVAGRPLAARADARTSGASTKLPNRLDDFDVVVTYTLERARGAETVTRRVSAHPVRDEKHHYFWIFRDC